MQTLAIRSLPSILASLVLASLGALLTPCHVYAQAAGAARPNILVILTDDQGWGDLSVHGNKNLSTPSIDSLARDGALCRQFFVCPLCSPTRAEFLTGRYHSRGGVYGVTSGAERLNLDETTIADVLRGAGYATGLFGKWHNGEQYPYHPNGRGFEEFYGFCSGHWAQYFDAPLERNGQPLKGQGYIVDDLTDRAMEFMQAQRGKPFFCYVAYNSPHSPFQVPDKYWEKFRQAKIEQTATDPKAEDIAVTRAALAMCENIDDNVGRMLAMLERQKLTQDTIVVFFTDNGPNSFRFNGGMKGRKGSLDEGGIRVPCLLRWPGKIPAGLEVTQIAGAIDLLPTLASLAGIEFTAKKPLDGKSLLPLLLASKGQSPAWADRELFTFHNGKVTVRNQQYRLDGAGGLFDIPADPGQTRNVAGDRPEVAARLAELAARFKREAVAPRVERPFTVGGRAGVGTPLPARDATTQGGIQRSASAPNASYFTRWTKTDDRILWDIEVLAAGEYSVSVEYTCPVADVGATVELRAGDASTSGTVSEAHDPPLDDQRDRVPRKGESYYKEFRPLGLGTLRLEQGRTQLVLAATKIPGKQVMDVQAVILTRK